MNAVIPRAVMDDIEVDVTDEDLRRGTVCFECPSCGGDGTIDWHPSGDEKDCIECSTRGYREASI